MHRTRKAAEMHSRLLQVVSKNICMVRKFRGLTMQDLSKKTGVNICMLSVYENGQRIPSLESLTLLSLALECSIDALVGTKPMTLVATPKVEERVWTEGEATDV